MGFKNGKIIRNEGFEPLELNEGNVEAIFNRCLPTGDEDCYLTYVIMPGVAKKESEGVRLSKAKVAANEEHIQYLLGQFKVFHYPNIKSIALNDGFVRYDNYVWTRDYDVLFKLYALALAGNCFRGFGNAGNDIATLVYKDRVVPILSPKDPNFPAWWETHKAEWGTPEK